MCYIHQFHVTVLVIKGHLKWQYTPKGPKSHSVTKDLFKWCGGMTSHLFAKKRPAILGHGLSAIVILNQNYIAFQLFEPWCRRLSTRHKKKKKNKQRKISFELFLWMSLTVVHFCEVWILPHGSPWKIRALVIHMQWDLKLSTLRSSGSGLDKNKEKNVISVLLAYFWLLSNTTWETSLAETQTAVFVLKCGKTTSGFLYQSVNGTSCAWTLSSKIS